MGDAAQVEKAQLTSHHTMASADASGATASAKGTIDVFGDEYFIPDTLPDMQPDELQAWLQGKLSSAARGIWIDLSGDVDAMGRVLPPALKAGFTLHRASGQSQMLLRGWSTARKDADPCPVGAYTIHIVDCAVVRGDGAVLMVKQTYDASGKFTFPGGFIDPLEPLEVAGRREVEEETGVAATPVALLHTRTIPRLPPGSRFGLSAVTHLMLLRPDDMQAALSAAVGETTAAGEIAECRWVPKGEWGDPDWAASHANDHLQVSLAQLASLTGGPLGESVGTAAAALQTCTGTVIGKVDSVPQKDTDGAKGSAAGAAGSYIASTCVPWEARGRHTRVYVPTVVSGPEFIWW